MNTTEPLNQRDVEALHNLVAAVASSARVRRLMPSGDIVEGIARYFSGPEDSALPPDIRDAHLRVTTVGGFETWWPVSDIAEQTLIGQFSIEAR